MEQNYENYKILQLFIKLLLKKGKKIKSEKILYKILVDLKKSTKKKPSLLIEDAVNNLLPQLKTISMTNNRNKKNYFLMCLTKDKQIKISFLWLLLNSNLKNIKTEIINTVNKKSDTLKLKKKYYQEIRKLKFNLKF